MSIALYCGLNNAQWNHHKPAPGESVCISPVYGIKRRRETHLLVTPEVQRVLLDSGAFSDNWSERLSFAEAWARQENHAVKFGYAHLIERRATYDLLIDEVWEEGTRHKRRWSESAAAEAVDVTVNAALWANENRSGQPLVISAQGVTAQQYMACVQRLMPVFRDGDALGLGGWCVIGKFPSQMMRVFAETLALVMPFAGREGIRHIHIWGVIYPPALGLLLWHAQQQRITISTDSAGPHLRPCLGEWGYGEWRDPNYRIVPAKVRGLERAKHVDLTRKWLRQFDQTQWVTPYIIERRGSMNQLAMF